MTIVATVLLTILAMLVIQNLRSGEKAVEHRIDHLCAAGDQQFERLMTNLLGPALLPGNRVVALHNGDAIFPAMLAAIREARRSVAFETYIYWSGEVGRQFAEALMDRARSGVPVHVLLDWVGSGKMDGAVLTEMEEAGVKLHRYHPPRWYNLGRLNNRTHRKLLIVDGKIGFTGGVGIADIWSGNGQDPEHWRDSHYRIEGPAVAQMQAAFMDNWIETTGELLHGDEYFPDIAAEGSQTAQVFKSSITDGTESVRLMYLLSISSATERIRIGNAYFVPDDLAVEALVQARQRGVTVEIIVPGHHIDAALVRRASRSRWGPLLEAGVAMFEYQPTMYHNKLMIVDGVWTSVGSTNFDSRSFRLNDEANLNVLDREFAEEQSRVFEEDRARSREITFESWRHRPLREKLTEWLAGTLRLQL